ncbi:MAG: hypothetical protein LIP09_05000 [Bacteroidales bacterium]|nr:hypothetical protein [Bacteroidales bacterium]
MKNRILITCLIFAAIISMSGHANIILHHLQKAKNFVEEYEFLKEEDYYYAKELEAVRDSIILYVNQSASEFRKNVITDSLSRDSLLQSMQMLQAKLPHCTEDPHDSYSATMYDLALCTRQLIQDSQESPITWQEVRERLANDEGAVELFQFVDLKGNPCYGALVLTKEMNYPSLVRLGSRKEIDKRLSRNKETHAYRTLWQPLERYFKGKHKVYYTPSGIFYRIPMEEMELYSGCEFDKVSSTGDIPDNSGAIPSEILKEPVDGPLPNPILKCGKSTITFHLIGDKKDSTKEKNFTMEIEGILDYALDVPIKIDDATGLATLEFDLAGTAIGFIYNSPYLIGTVRIAPDELMDVYIVYDEKGEDPAIYTTGSYANLNRIVNQYSEMSPDERIWDGSAFSYKMTGDEFTDELEKQYYRATKIINRQPWPQMYKESEIAEIQQSVLMRLRKTNMHLYKWDEATQTEVVLPLDSLNIKIEPKHIAQIEKLYDIDSPSLLMGANLEGYKMALERDWLFDNDTTHPQIQKINHALVLLPDAESGRLYITEKDRAEIGEMWVQGLINRNEKSINLKLPQYTQPVPDVPTEDLLTAIITPHKGKIVVIDLWNSWCRPCLYLISEYEPYKSGELASDEIVWIYIADTTSPIDQYIDKIKDIRGLHYRLTEEQMGQIKNQFSEIDGIPSCILVDRDGKTTIHNDFRDHSTFLSTLKGKLK